MRRRAMKQRTINKQYHRRHPTRRANGVYALCGKTTEEFLRGGNIGHDKQTYSAKPHGYAVFESLQEATEWRKRGC